MVEQRKPTPPEILEHQMFGDADFLKANAQARMRMGIARVYTLVEELAMDPSPEGQEQALHGLKRMEDIIHDFANARSSEGGSIIAGKYWLKNK